MAPFTRPSTTKSHIFLSAKRLGVLLGGAPSGIVQRFLAAAVETDRRAMDTISRSLSSTDRPFVAAFGTLSMKAGQLAIEDDTYDPGFLGAPRAQSEDTLQGLAALGIRTSAIRLAADRAWAPVTMVSLRS